MKNCCETPANSDPNYRRILWIALVLNALMFCVEIVTSIYADSASLQADSIDFLGDAGNYAISLYVLSQAIRVRATASIIKGSTMGIFGIWIIGTVVYNMINQSNPHPSTMTVIGFAALCVNFFVAILLFKYRKGDSNMQSVWVCTRNDVIGNAAVILAAGGVVFTKTMWPDLLVATFMGILSINSSIKILKLAIIEFKNSIATNTSKV